MSRADDLARHSTLADAHLAAIVESSSDAIISKDLNGIVQSWNRAAERIFGWTAEEMIGQSIRRIIPADRQKEEDSILSRVRTGELVPKFNTVRIRKDGAIVLVAITVSPIMAADGTIIGASKIAHDISEQAAIQQNLEISELRFRALADNIPQLAWMAHADGHLFWYNQRWYDYTGTDFQQMEGWGWSRVHHPEHLERVTEKWTQELARGEGWEDVFPLRDKDGQYRWFLSRAQPIRDAAGDVTMWFGTNTDITQQREHEEQIELLMGEVSHRSKNMLAIVQSILHRTAADVAPEFVAGFEKRIAALAANQDMLIHRGWSGATMSEIVYSQLQPVGELVGKRISLVGPEDLVIRPRAAEALGLAVHELLTNAIKYGALSNDEGEVRVNWQADASAEQPVFEVTWQESGGPPVTSPSRSGFGSILIERNVRAALAAKVDIDYAPGGLVWKVVAPFDKVVAP
ncbi:PAS domain S-box protein [Sphingomonas sp. HDW15A]|uniref:PAS domain S-box protein n=1 Tax=Sphingomonas sp. HDW15A TaxID=2714942 RepID=UPI00140828E7|nr:PAS domain S-box protein [Sphingomonas sp. HDW15A]QIK95597.1 PAS domain S-box protein [Sphingomonas sp. HDW15A]